MTSRTISSPDPFLMERALIEHWGGTGISAEPPRCVHELFRMAARNTPDALAVSCQNQRLTYRELEARAEHLADWLVEAGVGPDRIVAVLVERSTDLIVALLGTLMAGGCYLGLEPDTPEQRLRYLLSDAAPQVILTQHALRHRIPTSAKHILTLDNDWLLVERARPRAAIGVQPQHLAYVSYTSGSTGAPKGVCVPHAAVARLVRSPDWASFEPRDVFLHISPVAFDASTLEIWAPLLNGGRVVIYPPGPVIPDQLADAMCHHGITTIWLTAGLFHRLVDDHLDAFARLRHVLAGGDVVSTARVTRLLERYPDLLFTNGYGPTENTTFTTCWTTDQPPDDSIVPIGRPIRGTRIAILDAQLQPVPASAPGELYAGGVGLARCYLGLPKETALRFVPDPQGTSPGARLYRTGDLARWRDNGTVEFLGRLDYQVKIQGYRVELGEIEVALSTYPAVRDAVVIARDDTTAGRQLVAYVVFEGTTAANGQQHVQDLRVLLQAQLPAYMVPRVIIPLDVLPLTPNGKIDRAALPTSMPAPRPINTVYVAPRSKLESELTMLWSQLLGFTPVGINDDFFEMGGHSLLVAELISELERRLAIEVPARTMYLQPTVAELASAIEAMHTPSATGVTS